MILAAGAALPALGALAGIVFLPTDGNTIHGLYWPAPAARPPDRAVSARQRPVGFRVGAGAAYGERIRAWLDEINK